MAVAGAWTLVSTPAAGRAAETTSPATASWDKLGKPEGAGVLQGALQPPQAPHREQTVQESHRHLETNTLLDDSNVTEEITGERKPRNPHVSGLHTLGPAPSHTRPGKSRWDGGEGEHSQPDRMPRAAAG